MELRSQRERSIVLIAIAFSPRRRPMVRQRRRAYRLTRFIIFRGRVIVLVHLCPDGIHRDGERYSASHSGG